jgi:hypothetical protein
VGEEGLHFVARSCIFKPAVALEESAVLGDPMGVGFFGAEGEALTFAIGRGSSSV